MSRYIEADKILPYISRLFGGIPLAVMKMAETDGIDIVRCQDCKYWVYNFNGCSRNPCTEPWYATDFCNYGERERER